MHDCDSTTKIAGLGSLSFQLKPTGIYSTPLSTYFSCDACLDATKIPVSEVFSGTNADGTTSQMAGTLYTWDLTNPLPANGTGYNQTMCLSIDTTWNLPPNCGAALVISDVSNIPFCVACQAGYYPSITSNQITACTVSQNCLTTQFNGCLTCMEGFGPTFSISLGVIDYYNCILMSDSPNCFSGLNDASGNLVCIVCSPGYYLNHDNFCDKVQIDGCVTSSFYIDFFAQSPNSGFLPPLEFLLFYPTGGCLDCLASQMLVFEEFVFQYCVENSFFVQNSYSSSSYFGKNCDQSYFMISAQTIGCATCSISGQIAFSGTCYDNSTLTNVGTIMANCVIVDPFSRRCLLCLSGFRLAGGLCLPGTATNCKDYTTAGACSNCITGYLKFTDKNGNVVCLENPATLNCAQFDESLIPTGIVSCLSCQANHYQATSAADMPVFSCLPYDAIPNCNSYNIQEYSINATNFECLSCKSGYYLSKNRCVAVTSINLCVNYSTTTDVCTQCSSGYLLQSDGKACLAPIATQPVSNCFQIGIDTACLFCNPGYHMTATGCLAVPEAFQVFNCEFYSSDMSCSSCVYGFFLLNNTCVPPKAQNCKTYQNISACLSCPTGFGFEVIETTLNCSPVDIEHCLVFNTSQIKPWTCLTCETLFYFDKSTGACEAMSSPIIDCLYYSDLYSCEKCNPGTVISSDGTFCYSDPFVTSMTDPNCDTSVLKANPECSICAIGHEFVNGTCVPSSCYSQAGCLFCNSKTDIRCAICRPGYFMPIEGICFLIVEKSGATRFGVVLAIIFLLLTCFN
jgi:hypothetical protein